MGRNGKASDFEATLAKDSDFEATRTIIIFPLLAVLFAIIVVRATWSLEPVLAVILAITLIRIAWPTK